MLNYLHHYPNVCFWVGYGVSVYIVYKIIERKNREKNR
jgi:hypothetical protein